MAGRNGVADGEPKPMNVEAVTLDQVLIRGGMAPAAAMRVVADLEYLSSESTCIRDLRDALGLHAGALDETPRDALLECVAEGRRLRTEIDVVDVRLNHERRRLAILAGAIATVYGMDGKIEISRKAVTRVRGAEMYFDHTRDVWVFRALGEEWAPNGPD